MNYLFRKFKVALNPFDSYGTLQKDAIAIQLDNVGHQACKTVKLK